VVPGLLAKAVWLDWERDGALVVVASPLGYLVAQHQDGTTMADLVRSLHARLRALSGASLAGAA
jgi:hypothetical protein